MSAALGRSVHGRLPFLRSALVALAFLATAPSLRAQEAEVQLASNNVELYTAEELDNLLAPVALYPDPILAQVLVAASYPEQVELAARYVQVNGVAGVDNQPWDISVRAVAHYAPVLNLMADRIDWTTALGQAHATQPGDVMASVQSLRTMARAQGNLVTTAQQEVVEENKVIYIVPAQPRVIYVPTYDPLVIYHRPVVHVGVYRSGWSFGIGFPIGVWLNYDVDWHQRHVYYHGWHDYRYHRHGRGWYARSRPHIVVNNIYINTRHTRVVVNRTVINRRVHYDRLGGYNQVHRRVTWDRRRVYEDRRHVARSDDRRPSWDRNRSGGGDRSGPARYERGTDRTPDRRVARGDNGSSQRPSWDRSGRQGGSTGRPGNASPRNDDRSAPRGDPRAAPRGNTGTNGNRSAAPQRAPTSRVEAMRTVARAQPRTQPQRAQPQRTQPQRTQPQRTQPQRTQPQRTQPQRVQPQRTQPQRSQPQRTQPQRVQAQRSAPQVSNRGATRSQGASAPRSSGGRASVAKPRGEGRRVN